MAWLPHIPVADAGATQNFEAIEKQIIVVTGSPQGEVQAPIGTIALRKDGEVGATMYVKESAAITGWVAK